MRSVFVALALAGCVRSGLVTCDDGRACPAGTACDAVHATCVDPDQLEVCKAAEPGASCEGGGVIGRCDRGVCLPPIITPFGAAEPLAGINTSAEEDDVSLTGDLTAIFFLRNNQLLSSQRASATDPWPLPELIEELDSPDVVELRPSVSADGLTLYFTRRVSGQPGDIYVSVRTARSQRWSPPFKVNLDIARPDAEELCGWSSENGLSLLVMTTNAAGDNDVFLATRPRTGVPFTSVPLDAVNSTGNDSAAWATADGSRLVFASDRDGTTDIFEAVRRGDTWEVEPHRELSTGRPEGTPWLSPDGAVIVFTRSGTQDDLFMARRAPPP